MATPLFIHDRVQLPNGSVEERRNSWHPSMGRVGNKALREIVARFERSNPGARVLSAVVQVHQNYEPEGDVRAEYRA